MPGSNVLMLTMTLNEGKLERQMHIDAMMKQETQNAMIALTGSSAFRNRVVSGTPISLLDGTSISTRPEGFQFPPPLPDGERTYQIAPPSVIPWDGMGPPRPEEAPPANREGSDLPRPPPPPSTAPQESHDPPPPPPQELRLG